MEDKDSKEVFEAADTKQTTLEFDELLRSKVGEFGKKQKILSMLLVFSSLGGCIHSLSSVFIAGVPDHWCRTEDEIFSNCTESQSKVLTIPTQYKNGQTVYNQCQRFSFNYTDRDVEEFCQNNGSFRIPSETETVACDKWQFDNSVYSENIVTEWGVVCSQAGFASTVAAAYMVGRIVGCLFAGQLADKFGRRRPLLITGVLFLIVSFACSLMPNYFSFVFTRLLLSVFMTIRDTVAVLLAVELVGPSWRVFVTVAWLVFWSLGYFVLAGCAYVVGSWRILQAVLTVPELILVAVNFIYIPESPRWLLVKNKQEPAMKIIRNIAKGNGRTLPNNIVGHAQEEKVVGTYLDLVKTPSVRWISVLLFYGWFANSFVYYGLSLNASNLGGSPYINFMVSGAVEIPAYAYMWWSFAKFGRLRPYGGVFILAGVSLLAIMVVPPDLNWLVITFAMVGKCAISASFGMVWMYTMEIYPTSIRALGLGMCSTFARIASVPASYVGLLSEVSRELPLLIFGAMALLGGVLVFVLPETRDQPMRQTVQEGEEFIRQNMCQFGPCKRFGKKQPQVTQVELEPMFA